MTKALPKKPTLTNRQVAAGHPTAAKTAKASITASSPEASAFPMSMIRIMISSKCDSMITMEDGSKISLSDLRLRAKRTIESEKLFDHVLFEVWINEPAPAAPGDIDSTEKCLKEVRQSDIVLVWYNGNAGWARYGSEIGICHAELQEALNTAPAKVRIVKLPDAKLGKSDSAERNIFFKDYINNANIFRASANNGDAVIYESCRAIREAVGEMAKRGIHGSSHAKYYSGEPLQWNRMDLKSRCEVMKVSLREALLGRANSQEGKDRNVVVDIGGKQVLTVCHAIPGPMTSSAARELVGQPFLNDHDFVPVLGTTLAGPLHIIACHRSVTETQGLKTLGIPIATVLSPPCCVYVADEIQNVQLIFLPNCRDDTTLRFRLQEMFSWLIRERMDGAIAAAAQSRSHIVMAVAKQYESRRSSGSLVQPHSSLVSRKKES